MRGHGKFVFEKIFGGKVLDEGRIFDMDQKINVLLELPMAFGSGVALIIEGV